MKVTNYQKQQMKQYSIKFSDNITFEEAQKKINKAVKDKENQEFWPPTDNINIFSHWDEDL